MSGAQQAAGEPAGGGAARGRAEGHGGHLGWVEARAPGLAPAATVTPRVTHCLPRQPAVVCWSLIVVAVVAAHAVGRGQRRQG